MHSIVPDVIRLLLIEDSSVDAEIVKRILRSNPKVDFQVGHVMRLGEALQKLCEESFDVCVLDLMLPDGSQLDSIQEIRAVDGIIPIVVMSGVVDEELALRSVRRGAQDFVSKNKLTGEQLLLALRLAVVRQRKALGLRASPDRDSMTGIPNSRNLRDQFAKQKSVCLESGMPMTIAIIDVHGLGRINQTAGYLVGDAVLSDVASIITDNLGNDMWACRFGGQQFVVLMPCCNRDQAIARIDAVKSQIAGVSVKLNDHVAKVTATSGVILVGKHSFEESFVACNDSLEQVNACL